MIWMAPWPIAKRQFALAYRNRGLLRMQQGNSAAAIADYNLALRHDPNYADAYESRGRAYAARGEQDRAIADYDKAIALRGGT